LVDDEQVVTGVMKETCLRQLLSDSFTSSCAAITCSRLTMMMMMMALLMPAPVSSTLSLRYRDDESATEADWLANQLDADVDQGAIQSSASNSYQINSIYFSSLAPVLQRPLVETQWWGNVATLSVSV